MNISCQKRGENPTTRLRPDIHVCTMCLLVAVMPEPGGPQYLADQLTLFQPGEGRLSPPITSAPPYFFTFQHHWVGPSASRACQTLDFGLVPREPQGGRRHRRP